MNTKMHYKNNEKGFTLVETLIAIAILVMAVLAPMAIAQSGLQGARYAQDQMTAVFLAQEAVELVKSQAYSNMNETVDWLKYLNDATANCVANDCEVSGPRTADQPSGLPIRQCSGVTPCKVYVDPASNLFTSSYKGTVPTKFTRVIRLKSIVGNTEEKITVTITWTAPDGTQKTYTVNDYITRWY